ncbi:MAG: hypothetical protein C0497_02850 [Gemmatimonas sp.]|nr:hypothetical protein [Gemmatimonas sp.]
MSAARRIPNFVVFLRGVNVGKGNRVPMAEFRALLEAQGFTDVRTLLNSGNAVFHSRGRSATAHAKTISAALQERLGVQVHVVVKTASDFLAVVAENTIAPAADQHSRFLVAFAQEHSAIEALSTLLPLVRAPERLLIGTHAAYLHCARGILESQAASALLGKAGRAVTTRNWATVLTLEKLLRGGLT